MSNFRSEIKRPYIATETSPFRRSPFKHIENIKHEFNTERIKQSGFDRTRRAADIKLETRTVGNAFEGVPRLSRDLEPPPKFNQLNESPRNKIFTLPLDPATFERRSILTNRGEDQTPYSRTSSRPQSRVVTTRMAQTEIRPRSSRTARGTMQLTEQANGILETLEFTPTHNRKRTHITDTLTASPNVRSGLSPLRSRSQTESRDTNRSSESQMGYETGTNKRRKVVSFGDTDQVIKLQAQFDILQSMVEKLHTEHSKRISDLEDKIKSQSKLIDEFAVENRVLRLRKR